MIVSQFPAGFGEMEDGRLCPFGYTGNMELTSDAKHARFLTSGTLTVYWDMCVDVFLVGGGGSGGSGYYNPLFSDNPYVGVGGGGGGGYTHTERNVFLPSGVYNLTIGRGGGYLIDQNVQSDGESTTFTNGGVMTFTATGGKGGASSTVNAGSTPIVGKGGDGGSGGATGSMHQSYDYSGLRAGGTDGQDGEGVNPGTGQGTTSRAFGEQDGELFASGGGSVFYGHNASYPSGPLYNYPNGFHGADNTGDGGYGGTFYVGDVPAESGVDAGGKGGSGIIIIRSAEVA